MTIPRLVVRSTTGSLFHVPIVVGADVADVMARCRAAGLTTIAADVKGDDLLAAFRRADKDASGSLSAAEFAAVLATLAQFDSQDKIDAAVKAADVNGNGDIDYKEWIAANEAD